MVIYTKSVKFSHIVKCGYDGLIIDISSIKFNMHYTDSTMY